MVLVVGHGDLDSNSKCTRIQLVVTPWFLLSAYVCRRGESPYQTMAQLQQSLLHLAEYSLRYWC